VFCGPLDRIRIVPVLPRQILADAAFALTEDCSVSNLEIIITRRCQPNPPSQQSSAISPTTLARSTGSSGSRRGCSENPLGKHELLEPVGAPSLIIPKDDRQTLLSVNVFMDVRPRSASRASTQ